MENIGNKDSQALSADTFIYERNEALYPSSAKIDHESFAAMVHVQNAMKETADHFKGNVVNNLREPLPSVKQDAMLRRFATVRKRMGEMKQLLEKRIGRDNILRMHEEEMIMMTNRKNGLNVHVTDEEPVGVCDELATDLYRRLCKNTTTGSQPLPQGTQITLLRAEIDAKKLSDGFLKRLGVSKVAQGGTFKHTFVEVQLPGKPPIRGDAWPLAGQACLANQHFCEQYHDAKMQPCAFYKIGIRPHGYDMTQDGLNLLEYRQVDQVKEMTATKSEAEGYRGEMKVGIRYASTASGYFINYVDANTGQQFSQATSASWESPNFVPPSRGQTQKMPIAPSVEMKQVTNQHSPTGRMETEPESVGNPRSSRKAFRGLDWPTDSWSNRPPKSGGMGSR